MAHRKLPPPSAAISDEVLSKFKAVVALTDAFCKRYLNEEYVRMCRRLAMALARKQPSPLTRGRKEVWACGIVRTIGWVNVLDDPKSSPYMKLIDIDPKFGLANSTGQGKCMAIKRMFGIGRLNPDWTLPSRLGDNTVVWKVWINDELVDIRQESREEQEKAFRKGLIPWIPADREDGKAPDESEDKATIATVEGDLFQAEADFYRKSLRLLRQFSSDDEKLKSLSRRIKQVMESVLDEIRHSPDLDVARRIESAYKNIQHYAKELSSKTGSR